MAVFINYELLCERAYWIAFSNGKWLGVRERKALNWQSQSLIGSFITRFQLQLWKQSQRLKKS